MFAETFLGGITPGSIEAFFKGTGILGAVFVLIYLMIKYRVIRLVSVDQATELIRAKWGVAQYHRFGKRRGRLVRLKAGRHLLIRGMYDGWEICLKEIVLDRSSVSQPCHGRMLSFDLITLGYEVIAPDSSKGDDLMLRSFLSVQNPDRDNQASSALDAKVMGIALASFGRYLGQAPVDDYGLPVLEEKPFLRQVNRKLKRKHGVRLSSFEWVEPTWLVGQQAFDAGVQIANALGYQQYAPGSQSADCDEPQAVVIPMTEHAQQA